MKITIVTAYYNRRDLFIKSLETISHTSHGDFDVIAVNDASDSDQEIDDLPERFPFLKVINIKKEEKTWVNPCIPYNIGFSNVDSDVIIIQNPECLHMGDIISYVSENIVDNKYMVFNCYSVNKPMTNVLGVCNTQDEIKTVVTPFLPAFNGDGNIGWYNHSVYRPVHYHFCSAITYKDLKKIKGFDERFSQGVGFDDNEMLERIDRSDIQLHEVNSEELVAIHQYHEPGNYGLGMHLVNRNRDLLMQIKKEQHIGSPENTFFN
tara:strand:+ start:911 stop:1702 length:792 start_codon:yes stop_codon:yes gene_type:complete